MTVWKGIAGWSGWSRFGSVGARGWAMAAAAIVLVGACAPYAAGFGYGLALWPAYEVGCPTTSGDRGPPDSYRTFLLGHGCDARTAFEAAAAGLGVTPQHLRSAKARVDAGETVSPDDARRVAATAEILGRFRDSLPACPPTRWDCVPEGLSPSWNGPIERFFGWFGDNYLRFAGPAFYTGLGLAASNVSFIAWQGPLQRGALDIAYAIALVMAAALTAITLMKHWTRRRGE